MTEPSRDPADYRDPADRRPVKYGETDAIVTDPTGADPEPPSYATTDVDPTLGSPRSFVASEPNFATTDIDPMSGTARTDGVPHPTGGAAVHLAVDSVRQHTTTPWSGKPLGHHPNEGGSNGSI